MLFIPEIFFIPENRRQANGHSTSLSFVCVHRDQRARRRQGHDALCKEDFYKLWKKVLKKSLNSNGGGNVARGPHNVRLGCREREGLKQLAIANWTSSQYHACSTISVIFCKNWAGLLIPRAWADLAAETGQRTKSGRAECATRQFYFLQCTLRGNNDDIPSKMWHD